MLRKIIHDLGKARALGGADPFHSKAVSRHTQIIEHAQEQRHAAAGKVIARGIMTITGVAAAQDDTIGATSEGPQNKQGINPAGTGNLDDFDIGRVIFAGRAGAVSTSVAAPITAKGHDFRFIGVVF